MDKDQKKKRGETQKEILRKRSIGQSVRIGCKKEKRIVVEEYRWSHLCAYGGAVVRLWILDLLIYRWRQNILIPMEAIKWNC